MTYVSFTSIYKTCHYPCLSVCLVTKHFGAAVYLDIYSIQCSLDSVTGKQHGSYNNTNTEALHFFPGMDVYLSLPTPSWKIKSRPLVRKGFSFRTHKSPCRARHLDSPSCVVELSPGTRILRML